MERLCALVTAVDMDGKRGVSCAQEMKHERVKWSEDVPVPLL